MGERDRFLSLLRDRRERFRLVVAEVGFSIDSDADLGRQAGGGWTLAEHLVHLAAWERRFARVVCRGQKLPYPSQWQRFNDAVWEEWKGVAPAKARAEYEEGFRELVNAVSALPEEGDPERPGLLRGWDAAMPQHYRDHAKILLENAGLPEPPVWRGRLPI
jgi:hypothetical protein